MARYDNIKVYNGSSWVKPSEICVWDGSKWISLGGDDSSNTSEMNVWNGSSWQRKTLNKKINTVTVDKYLQYNANEPINVGPYYQMYDCDYYMVLQPDNTENCTLFESYCSSTIYARMGIWTLNGTYGFYFGCVYTSDYAYRETNTNSLGTVVAGVKYTVDAWVDTDKQLKLSVYNHATGAYWEPTPKAAVRHVQNESANTCQLFGRTGTTSYRFTGKIWEIYLRGQYYGSGGVYNTSTVRYLMNNSTAGSSTLVATDIYGKAANATHYGTIVDPSYTYTTWE